MKLFNRIICILFILFCVSNAFSNGNDFSGGGDPDAVEYLGFLKKVPRFLFVRGLQDKLAPSQKVQDYIRKVKVSLDDEDTSNDLIQFQSEPVVVQGVEKVARFDSKIGRVTVHRGSWHLYKAKKQRALVIQETLLALGVRRGRYTTVGEIIFTSDENISDFLSEIKLTGPEVLHLTCNYVDKYKKKSGKIFEKSRFTSEFSVTWRVDNRNYSVVHFFPESDRVSGNQLIFALGEFYRDSVENGYISHHEVSGFAKNKRGILFNQKKRYSTLYRINDDSSEQIWTWNNKRNEAGKKIGRVFPAHIMYAKEGLEVRILKKDMNSKKTNGDVLLQSVETCVEQKLPDSWSSTFGDNKLKVGLKKIDRLVTHLRAIDGIYQKCLALEGQENCQDEKTQKERIKSKITKTWKTLYKLPKTERRKKYRFSRNRLSKYSEARSRVYRTLDRLEVGWVLEQGFIDYLSKN